MDNMYFNNRVRRNDVQFIALNKKSDYSLWIYPRLYRPFRKLQQPIVHTYNLEMLELVVAAWGARVFVRIHGEHGWDVSDLGGANKKYQWVRWLYLPFVNIYIALSRVMKHYMVHTVSTVT